MRFDNSTVRFSKDLFSILILPNETGLRENRQFDDLTESNGSAELLNSIRERVGLINNENGKTTFWRIYGPQLNISMRDLRFYRTISKHI